MIDFGPRPAKYRNVNVHHINNFLHNLQWLSQTEGEGISMWETQLQRTYGDYSLDCKRKGVLLKQVNVLHENLKPEALMAIPGTQQQSKSEKWFLGRWCRLTASKFFSAFKVGKLVTECQPNAAVEESKFIFTHVWGLESGHLQTYWMKALKGLKSEPKAILKYENV